MIRRIDRLIRSAKPGEERVIALLTRLRDLQPPEAPKVAKVKPARPKRPARPQTPITAILTTARDAITYAPPEAKEILERCERIITGAVARLCADGFAVLYARPVPLPPSRASGNDASQRVHWLTYAVDVSTITAELTAQIALRIERKTARSRGSSGVRSASRKSKGPQ